MTKQQSDNLHPRISIHAPREGGDAYKPFFLCQCFISIHAPREGGDDVHRWAQHVLDISIHAPREGGDNSADSLAKAVLNFNPRPPRGGRPCPAMPGSPRKIFQSTPPARGATMRIGQGWASSSNFNPRPPRGGRRPSTMSSPISSSNFNPRPPRGGRRCC